MDKELEKTKRKTTLEMFKEIKDLEVADSPLMTVEDCLPFMCEKVEQALLELEAIKESNPSEAMEQQIKQALDELYDVAGNIKNLNAEYNTIKQYILKAQEQENVLNWIIKHLSFENGGVGVVNDFITGKRGTKYFIKVKSKDTGATIHIHLDTKEESELLKRWQNE